MVYAGLDLHKRFSVITAADERGEEAKQVKVPNDGGRIVKLFRGLDGPVQVAMEATRNWQWLYDLLEENGIEPKLSHPLKTRAIASARIKNDKIDSKILAQLLRADLLPLSYVPPKEIRLQRELLRYRASLVKIQTGVKNRVHSILAKNNISHGFSNLFGRRGKAFLRELCLPQSYRMALDGYLTLLEVLALEIKEASKEIRALAGEDEEARLLMTIPGVGYYSALLIKCEIGDINRFPSPRKLCAYAGIIPSTHASGDKVYHGHIIKQGSKWLRWILSEVVEHCIDRPGPLGRHFSRLERRKGRNTAKIATERKLLTWIYYMLKEKKTFQEVEKVAKSWGEPVVTHSR